MHIAVIEDEAGTLRLIAPFQSERKNPLRWEGVGTNLINYNPILIRPHDGDSLRQLFAWLKHQLGWNRLVLRTSATSTLSRLFRLTYTASLNHIQKVRRWANLGSLFIEQDSQPNHPVISGEALRKLGDLPHHDSHHRSLRRLKPYGAPGHVTVTHADDAERYFDHLCKLHIAEWASRGRTSHLADPETRQFSLLFLYELASYQMLRMDVLTVDGRPIAFQVGAWWKELLEGWMVCFDIDYAKVSPGRLLFSYMIPSLLADGITELDLGRGMQDYKLQYNPEIRETVTMNIHRSPLHAVSYKLQKRFGS